MSTSTPRLSFLPDFPGRERLYQPLDASKKEIRVISVLSSTEPSAPIRCWMGTISISHEEAGQPRFGYNAISYFWDSTEPANRDTVTVRNESTTPYDDQSYEVPVTKNLAGALRQYRAEATAVGKMAVLWADAICINQLDARERSQQVMIMRDIYAFADIVCVWLGEPSPMAEKGLACIFDLKLCEQVDQSVSEHECEVFAHLANGVQPDPESLSLMWNNIPNDSPGGDHFEYDTSSETHSYLRNKQVNEWAQAVGALFRSTYWYRAWVVQEINANRTIALHCGQTRRVVHNLNQLHRFLHAKSGAIIVLSFEMNLPELRHVLHFFDIPGPALESHTLNHIVRGSETDHITRQGISGDVGIAITLSLEASFISNMPRAADPRDYVYARLGWSTGFRALSIEPLYDSSTEDVFTSTTVEILRNTRSWSHRHFFQPSKSPFLPSWAIDFSSIGKQDCKMPAPTDLGRVQQYVQADLSAKFRLSNPRPGLLLTSGFVADHVAAIAPLWRRAADFVCGLGKQETDVDDPLAKLREFLTSDMHQRWFDNNDEMSTWTDVMQAFCRTLYVGDCPPHDDYEGQMRAIHDQDLDYLRKHTFSVMMRTARFRDNRLVITYIGRIGLAPPDIQIDDDIAILAGGCMPFAIRKVGEATVGRFRRDTHILIGACYVDGIMNGEAVHQTAYEPAENFSSPSAGDLIVDSRLHRYQGALDEPTDEFGFLNDICLV